MLQFYFSLILFTMVNIFSASHLPQGKVWNVENFRLFVVQVKYWLFLTICACGSL